MMTDAEWVAQQRELSKTRCETIGIRRVTPPAGIHPNAARRYHGQDISACGNRAIMRAHIAYPSGLVFDMRLCPECAERMRGVVASKHGVFDETPIGETGEIEEVQHA